jgi:ppGpp synthetase/RelA/SpoT-type nucleotidyltranferase
MGVVEDFISRYTKEYDFYDQAARLAAQKLESDLREAGIRSIVTYRAKSISNLEEKCKQRHKDKGGYNSVSKIFDDIVDLAGVRVALYFPGERNQVDSAIVRLFDLIRPKKEFPEQSKHRPGKVFSGYSATHYLVHLREQTLGESGKRYATARIEIQVASVLMHAWSEVEHDLVYKPRSGDLSEDEGAILDELNGMVLAGEIALERLQRAGKVRVGEKERKIGSHWDLASYLLGRAASITDRPVSDSGLGRVDLLFDLMTDLKIDTPRALEPYLNALHDNFELRPLAEQVIDSLLGDNLTRYQNYQKIRERRSAVVEPAVGREQDAYQLGVFMSHWIELESILRDLLGPESRLVMPTRRQLERIPFISSELAAEIDRLRNIRNNLVHGRETPPAAYLAEAVERLKEITAEVRDLIARPGPP